MLLGAWLGAAVFADVAVTQNFTTVDRFLRDPGSAQTTVELNRIGAQRERSILRRNAGEENNFLFKGWESAELALGAALLALLAAGGLRGKAVMIPGALMLAIVAAQRIYLSPSVAALGRRMADVSNDPALTAQFWTLHGVYSGLEIVKLLAGAALACVLAVRKTGGASEALRPELVSGGRLRGA